MPISFLKKRKARINPAFLLMVMVLEAWAESVLVRRQYHP